MNATRIRLLTVLVNLYASVHNTGSSSAFASEVISIEMACVFQIKVQHPSFRTSILSVYATEFGENLCNYLKLTQAWFPLVN